MQHRCSTFLSPPKISLSTPSVETTTSAFPQGGARLLYLLCISLPTYTEPPRAKGICLQTKLGDQGEEGCAMCQQGSGSNWGLDWFDSLLVLTLETNQAIGSTFKALQELLAIFYGLMVESSESIGNKLRMTSSSTAKLIACKQQQQQPPNIYLQSRKPFTPFHALLNHHWDRGQSCLFSLAPLHWRFCAANVPMFWFTEVIASTIWSLKYWF